jgi:hypothetical protein
MARKMQIFENVKTLLHKNAFWFKSLHKKRMRRIAMILKKGIINSSEKGLKDEWTGDTFILRKDDLEKIRVLAYWERKKVKEVINEALGSYLNGKGIKPIWNERRWVEGREWSSQH